VFNNCDDSTRHKTTRTNDLPAAGDLGYLDCPPCNHYIDPATFAGRGDLEPTHLVARVDQDLNAVPLHNCTRVEGEELPGPREPRFPLSVRPIYPARPGGREPLAELLSLRRRLSNGFTPHINLPSQPGGRPHTHDASPFNRDQACVRITAFNQGCVREGLWGGRGVGGLGAGSPGGCRPGARATARVRAEHGRSNESSNNLSMIA